MYMWLLSVLGLLSGVRGVSLLSRNSSAASSQQNNDLWDSISQEVDSINPADVEPKHLASLIGTPKPGAGAAPKTARPGAAKGAGKAAGAGAERGSKADGVPGKTRILFGGHHRSGVRLLESLMMDYETVMKVPKENRGSACPDFSIKDIGAGLVVRPCQLNANVLTKFRALPGDKRIVHIVRDPIKFVVSAYVYHRMKDDGVFDKNMSAKELRSMSIRDGMAVFAEFAVGNWLKDMVDVYELTRSSADTLTLHLEDFTVSEAKFNTTTEQLYRFLVSGPGGEREVRELREGAARFDLANRTREFAMGSLFMPNMTFNAYHNVWTLPREVLRKLLDMRGRLGYNVD